MFVCPECGLPQPQMGHCPQDGTPLAPRGDDLILGQTLGAYRVARLLGVGGMGRVYKGVHPQIGSRVAIKVLSYECAQRSDLVERFFSEARAVNLIRHESIVNVLDLSTLPDGRPFIIMEYLDGAPLAAIVEKAGPLPLGSLARLVAEVLDALGAAHAKGIVHRDLKPDNIYITPAGRPKVLDFGIAKLHQNLGAGSSTQTGSLLGTPHYMSPEQAMGRVVDLRTDVYAIGVILFECATGRRPFEAESLFDLLRKHVDVPPPPPRSVRPDMPPTYEHVILRALEKNPDARFASANALSQALQHATQGLAQDQWMSITPGSASAIAAQRTPMSWPSGQQSWPGAGSQPHAHLATPNPAQFTGPTHNYGMVPPGVHAPTPHAGPGPSPHASTVSSGQVVAPSSSGGGKGLWIAIAIVAVLGGGGAAAYFATRDGGGASASASGATDDAPVAADDEPTAVVEPSAAGDDDDEALQERLDKQLDEIEKKMEQLEAEAPAAGTRAPSNVQAPPTPTPTPTPTPSAPKPKAKTLSGPIPLDLPSGWDPKAFDITGYYKTAEAEAKSVWPDAKLVRIDANGVRPSGKAELTLSDDFYVRYWFRSEKESKRPADLPVGMEHEATCNLQIWVDQGGVKLLPMSWECDEILVPPPKCTFEEAWAKAIKAGAPGGNAIADVSYMANIVSKQIRWFVTVGDEFSEQLPDGC
jgi:serine/threonine-protein kinase